MRLSILLLAGLLVPAATAASIDHTSPLPSEGDYTLTVAVRDFQLGTDGHIVYVFNGDAVTQPTTSLFHKFPALEEGDWIAAELVNEDGNKLFPRAYAALLVRENPEERTPGFAAPMTLLGLAALALARRT